VTRSKEKQSQLAFIPQNGTFAFFGEKPPPDENGEWENVNEMRERSSNATLFDELV
jgi:hypothetical protein